MIKYVLSCHITRIAHDVMIVVGLEFVLCGLLAFGIDSIVTGCALCAAGTYVCLHAAHQVLCAHRAHERAMSDDAIWNELEQMRLIPAELQEADPRFAAQRRASQLTRQRAKVEATQPKLPSLAWIVLATVAAMVFIVVIFVGSVWVVHSSVNLAT